MNKILIFFKIIHSAFNTSMLNANEFSIGSEIPSFDMVQKCTVVVHLMSFMSLNFILQINFKFRRQEKIAWNQVLHKLVFCQKILVKNIETGFVFFLN